MQGWDGNSLGAPILVPARVGLGFTFDGVDDYVSTPLTSIFEPAITIDAWVWVDNFTTSQMDIVSIDHDWLGIAKNGRFLLLHCSHHQYNSGRNHGCWKHTRAAAYLVPCRHAHR